MNLSGIIIGPLRAIVKGANVRMWLALERLAKWILARSFRHITPAQRHARAAHSDALHKAPIVRLRAWTSTADRN